MTGVAVVTDSTASLDPEEAVKAGVAVIPLQVVIDDISRAEAPGAVTPAIVARALREGKRVTTSRPTPEAFGTAYAELARAGYSGVVSVHLSRAISGTCAAASVAASSAAVPVTVVDSATLAMATGFAVLSGAAAARSGANAAAVADIVRRRAAAATTYFYVDSLEFLRRGGRIGAAVTLLGSALSVKPLLTVTEGEIRPYERVRTSARALARLEELSLTALARDAGRSDYVDIAVHHLDNIEGAQWLVDRLASPLRSIGVIVVSEVSAVLGAHVGPGALGVVVSPRV
jgi:DegV family protein with EDD domain